MNLSSYFFFYLYGDDQKDSDIIDEFSISESCIAFSLFIDIDPLESCYYFHKYWHSRKHDAEQLLTNI